MQHLSPYVQSFKTPFVVIWQDPLGKVGALLLTTILLVAIFAPFLATHDPNTMNERIEGTIIPFSHTWGRVEIISHKPLNDVAILSPNEAIAVGEDGQIFSYSAPSGWVPMESPSRESLHAVSFLDSQLGMAVGHNGTILIFDGSWQEMLTPTQNILLDIDLIAPDLAFAVGQGGTILTWNGEIWQEFPSPTTMNLNSISFSSPTKGAAVGDRGTILVYRDGGFKPGTYRSFLDPTFRNLIGVHIYSENLGFAVGERGVIMGFDGQDWYSMTSPESREIRAVAIVSHEEAYAAGRQGILLDFDGESWKKLQTGYRRHFRGLDVISGFGFAVGTDPYINELAPPSRDHLFGTTHLGRDIWSQVMYGSRIALLVGITAALVVNIIGVTVGLVAGYYRGTTDSLLMRITDIMYGLPLEAFAIILVLIFGPSLWIIILAIGLLTWRTNARVIRSQVLSLAQRPFIKAARVAGASHLRILFVHIAPNILPLAFLQLAVAIAYAITAEATLSFLGLGPPQLHSWGTILHAARLSGAWRTAWWWVLPPGIFITITVVSVFLISRSLEVLTNPRLRGGKKGAP